MAIGAFLEPLIVVSFLTFGTIVNRNKSYSKQSRSAASTARPHPWQHLKYDAESEYDDVETGQRKEDERVPLHSPLSRSSSSSGQTLAEDDLADKPISRTRKRKVRFMGWEREVTTPNTEVFKDRLLSRVLQRFPFLVEVWYWALIYWVCWPRPRMGSSCIAMPLLTAPRRSTNWDALLPQ